MEPSVRFVFLPMPRPLRMQRGTGVPKAATPARAAKPMRKTVTCINSSSLLQISETVHAASETWRSPKTDATTQWCLPSSRCILTEHTHIMYIFAAYTLHTFSRLGSSLLAEAITRTFCVYTMAMNSWSVVCTFSKSGAHGIG